MAFEVSVGTHCSLLLPRDYVARHRTPATGLITNVLLDTTALVLLEEVWKELSTWNWDWVPVPKIIPAGNHLMIPVAQSFLLPKEDSYISMLVIEAIKDIINIDQGAQSDESEC